MNVKLIAITKPIDEDISTAEFVGYVARVSNPANQDNHATSGRLLNYLKNNQHWSPFEMAHAVLEINTTRDIARQILRHRSFSFQEFSQRYAEVVDFESIRETRMQDKSNRQSSIECTDDDLISDWGSIQDDIILETKKAYQWALDNGIAKEVARVVLPEGLTKSKLYMAGSIRSWIHYIDLRTTAGTQKEHREIAEQCRIVLAEVMPEVFNVHTNTP